MASFTTKCVDRHGTERWTTRTAIFRTRDIPAPGTPVAVLFGPHEPSNERRIYVGPLGSRTAEDFGRWRLDVQIRTVYARTVPPSTCMHTPVV